MLLKKDSTEGNKLVGEDEEHTGDFAGGGGAGRGAERLGRSSTYDSPCSARSRHDRRTKPSRRKKKERTHIRDIIPHDAHREEDEQNPAKRAQRMERVRKEGGQTHAPATVGRPVGVRERDGGGRCTQTLDEDAWEVEPCVGEPEDLGHRASGRVGERECCLVEGWNGTG
jgi:hypothetical protein